MVSTSIYNDCLWSNFRFSWTCFFGTSSKATYKETDARFVGYLGAVGEGVLALIAIIAVITFFPSKEEFLATYSSFGAASSGGLGAFIKGASNLAAGLVSREVFQQPLSL